jgi:geranylgeranyl diphosphate synthase type 3
MTQQVVLEPYKYLAEIPGKEVRTLLISSFNKWFQVGTEELKKVTELIQMLHNASLL